MHHEIIKRFSRRLIGARNGDEAFDCVATSGRDAGFGHALFIAMPQPGSVNGPIRPFAVLSSHPQLHDPDRFARFLANSSLAKEVADRLCAVSWLTRDLGLSGNRNDIEMQTALETATVHHGVTVPIFGLAEEFSLLNFFSGVPGSPHSGVPSSSLAMFQQLAAQFTFHALRYLRPAPAGEFLLSIPEIRCLRKIAEGLTLGEIAKHLGISHHTVKYYLRRATQRLGARNRSNAVAIASAMGLIGPMPHSRIPAPSAPGRARG